MQEKIQWVLSQARELAQNREGLHRLAVYYAALSGLFIMLTFLIYMAIVHYCP